MPIEEVDIKKRLTELEKTKAASDTAKQFNLYKKSLKNKTDVTKDNATALAALYIHDTADEFFSEAAEFFTKKKKKLATQIEPVKDENYRSISEIEILLPKSKLASIKSTFWKKNFYLANGTIIFIF